jgi:DNA mismatch repair protein MutL
VKIQILSERMASQIAAGEVVERPASVVKELIENSLDAGATEISVAVEKSGMALIRVVDNGEGIAREDLPLSVERHSTSKLKDEADLFCIATLGFRGEALPSIGSVSKMEVVSRPADAEAAYRLRVEGGQKTSPYPTAAAGGTTVEIRDIFFNTPARRKFLKSPATELSHICDVVNRLALAYPAVHFRLIHDGRTVADYVGVTDGKDRLEQVLGPAIAGRLLRFSSRTLYCTVSGYLSSTPTSFPNTRYLFTFVNQRYVRDKILNHAALHGYETLLMKGQYPALVLFLEIPCNEVDVNVHPAKYEVRFRRQSAVHDAVSAAVRQALKHVAKQPMSTTSVPVHPIAETTTACVPYETPFNSGGILAVNDPALNGGFFSSMNVLGQILGCYLVCSSQNGLALIDQHAAHERVMFEKLRQQLDEGRVQQQSLLIPQVVEFSPGETMLMEQHISLMERFGFTLEPFGPHTYAIAAVPVLLGEDDYRPMVQRMIAELAEVDKSDGGRHGLEERLATVACHSVIRANRRLEPSEIRALLEDLDRIDFATQCPHGRPVMLEFSRDALEKMFKRV